MPVQQDGERIRPRAARVDELPVGIVDDERATILASIRRLPDGRAASPEDMRRLASLGGRAKREKARIASRLGVDRGQLPPQLLADAEAFRRSECGRLARLVGGGTCGAAPSSMVASAALALAASRHLYAQGDYALASRLGTESRQSLLAAHELCAKEAEARRRLEPPPWLRARAVEPDEDEPSVGDTTEGDDEDETAPERDQDAAAGDDGDDGSAGGPGDA